MKFFIYLLLLILNLSYSTICPYLQEFKLDKTPKRFQGKSEIKFYQPLNLNHDLIYSSNLESQNIISSKDSHSFPNIKDFRILLHVNRKVPTWRYLSMDLDKLTSSLKIKFPSFQQRFSSKVFMKGEQFEKSIDLAVEILENYQLESKERIWVLAVLKHLQDYLPHGELKPMNTDMKLGPIRHAALQLHLTRGLDLLGVSQKLWKSDKSPKLLQIDLALSEALSRLKIIDWITSQFKMNEVTKLSPFMVKTYDILLQESCPIEEGKLKTLLSKCTKNLQSQDIIRQEKELSYIILQKYEVIYPTVKDFLKLEKSKNKILKKSCEYQELPKLINHFLKHKDLGPFRDPIKFFLEERNMNMNSIQLVIKSIINTKQSYQRWDSFKSKNLAIQEDLVIRLLHHISSHINGAESYLEGLVNHSIDSHIFTVKMPEFNSIGQRCVVCQQDMYEEDNLVKLHLEVDHKIHMDCLKRMKNNLETPICPICRERIVVASS
ncbi:hypothetical protein DFH28DRAFT_966196 [Melampsora americana]|nr:hypothetical protein DFH28DRAFT_966196 [Melampsora americana]